MARNGLIAAGVTLLLLIGSAVFLYRRRRARTKKRAEDANALFRDLPEPTELAKSLKAKLPHNVLFPTDKLLFKEVLASYWARHNREVIPGCFVRPRNTEQLQEAVALIREEHGRRLKQGTHVDGLFTIKSGGAAPAIGGSTLKDGVVIDLSLFRGILISKDRSSVTVGAGLKWADIYAALESEGLTVPGGRTLPVGVGGLSLQGGLSFYSPTHGLVCSSIISYEVVLADGSAVVASESSHPDLWRALKGGSNNFGIVTSFTLPSIPLTDIWFGCSYMLGFQAPTLIKAFHDWLEETRLGAYDPNASIPITAFGYTDLGIHGTANYLMHTKPDGGQKWPSYWKKSPFGKLFHLYSTAKVQTLLQAVIELSGPSPSGNYNVMVTTTCKNDLETLRYFHKVYCELAQEVKGLKGLVLSLVLQPLLPQWMNNGYPNVLGLEDVTEPLIIIEITTTWTKHKDSELARGATKRALERMEAFSTAHQTAHRYKFANYSAEWQDPMKSYGEKNLNFMRSVSRKYDSKGLFQKGCLGAFKLGIREEVA